MVFDELQDSISWRWTASGQYSAKSAYDALLIGRIPSTVMPKVWKTKAIPKCRMHAWLLLQNKCLTADNLAKRGWPHNPTCRLCMVHPETALHISASCSYSVRVWEEIVNQLQVPAYLAPTVNTANLQSWWLAPTHLPEQLDKRWRSISLLTWWMLWKERNNRIFNAKARSPKDLVDSILMELASWRTAGVLNLVWPPGD